MGLLRIGLFTHACHGTISHLQACVTRSSSDNLRNLKCTVTRKFNLMYDIIYEDDFIVAVNKPANVLTVPGKDLSITEFIPRNQKWTDSVLCVINDGNLNEHHRSVLERMVSQSSMPRGKTKFLSYFQRLSKIDDESELNELWTKIEKVDFSMHFSLPAKNKEEHLVSMCEVLEDKYNQKLFHIHRLDQETSGLVIFAKTELAASLFCKLFHDRKVCKRYIAKVHGKVSCSLSRIDIPIRSDLENRPMQVNDLFPMCDRKLS